MKDILYRIFDIFTWPLALIWNARVSSCARNLCNRLRARILRTRFKGGKNMKVFGTAITGAKYIFLGDNVEISHLARIDAVDYYPNTGQRFTPELKLGSNVVVQTNCHIGCINRVEIGAYTTIAARTYITDHTHGTVELEDLKLPPRHRKLYSKGPVVIGECVSIGEGCAIMPGVTIGCHSVIGANSVVTKDIPPYSVAVGNPARVIRCYQENNN